MKKLIFVLGLGLIIGMANINTAEAQMHVSINIDVQPAWGPSGYNYAEFYFIPEINVYYDVRNRIYHYRDGRRWLSSVYLPMAYNYYDFYSLYKVVLNGVRNPWRSNRNHISLYSGYRYNYAQVPIFYVMEPRYNRARVNYYGWVEPRYMPRNSGRPNSYDFRANTRNGRIGDSHPAPNNRRDAVSPRSSNQRSTTIDNRSSSQNNNRPAVSGRNNQNDRGASSVDRNRDNNANRNNSSSASSSNSNNSNSNNSSSSVSRSNSNNNSSSSASSSSRSNDSNSSSSSTSRSTTNSSRSSRSR